MECDSTGTLEQPLGSVVTGLVLGSKEFDPRKPMPSDVNSTKKETPHMLNVAT